jgi:FKBP-type peptidyl-prolyl cis-trans isomerase FklB
MYRLEKTIAAVLVLGVLVTSQSTAQTIKKAAKPAATVKKSTAAPVKAAPTATVLKNQMDSLSAAIGVSFSSSLASQGVSNINTEVAYTKRSMQL